MSYWEGPIVVRLERTFTFEINSDWEAETEKDARLMVDSEISALIGSELNRFSETWNVWEGFES